MLKRAKRASHIDPPASSNAIMRRARPYRGENPEPGKDVTESLTPRPELENSQDPKQIWSVGSYLGPLLASFFLISGLSYKTTFNSELRISSFPLYSI